VRHVLLMCSIYTSTRVRHLLVVVVPISKWNERNPMRREREGEVPVD